MTEVTDKSFTVKDESGVEHVLHNKELKMLIGIIVIPPKTILFRVLHHLLLQLNGVSYPLAIWPASNNDYWCTIN